MLWGDELPPDELVVCHPRVGYHGVVGSVEAGAYLISGEAVKWVARDYFMAFCGELGVEARRTRGTVEDRAQEVTWHQGEHPDVFALGSPPGNDLVQLRDGALLVAVGR